MKEDCQKIGFDVNRCIRVEIDKRYVYICMCVCVYGKSLEQWECSALYRLFPSVDNRSDRGGFICRPADARSMKSDTKRLGLKKGEPKRKRIPRSIAKVAITAMPNFYWQQNAPLCLFM